jgi:hypothetical protein
LHYFPSEILPSRPENVEVEALTEKSLKVSWTAPSQNPESIVEYVVNVTMLKSFDEDTEVPVDSYLDYDSYALAAARLSSTSPRPPSSTQSPLEQRTTQIKVQLFYHKNFDGETSL